MSSPTNDENLDVKRKHQIAYEYLCHLEEVKIWLEHLLKMELPPSVNLEENLANGVILALLGSFIAPKKCPQSKIYDVDMKKFNERGLHFKHTDNIMMFLNGLKEVGLPDVFHPETNDIYALKNPVRVIYCIHALSHLLAKKGIVPLIQNLYGQVEFAEEDLHKMQSALDKHGIKMPAFSKIGGILAGELSEDQAAIHAGVMLISEAIDQNDTSLLLERLKNPVLNFLRVNDHVIDEYMTYMKDRKEKKAKAAQQKSAESNQDMDVYDKILSQSEVQDSINVQNIDQILKSLSEALKARDTDQVAKCFISPDLGDVKADSMNAKNYAEFAEIYYEKLSDKTCGLSIEDVKSIIATVNTEQIREKIATSFVNEVENLLIKNDIKALLALLKTPPADFTAVDSNLGTLAYEFLTNFRKLRGNYDRETLGVALELLSIICAINKCIENQNHNDLYKQLQNPQLNLSELEIESSERYLASMIEESSKKAAKLGDHMKDLLVEEIVACVDNVNQYVKEELGKLEMVSKINDSLKNITADELIEMLLNSKGKFKNVERQNKHVYLQVLKNLKEKLEAAGEDSSQSIWHNDIQQIIDEYNICMKQAQTCIKRIDSINECIASGSSSSILPVLKTLDIEGLIPECDKVYAIKLKETLSKRQTDSWNGWLDHTISAGVGYTFYYNHKESVYDWVSVPTGFTEGVGYLNMRIIQEVCNRVGSEHNRGLYFQSNLQMIVVLQNFYKTYFAHHAYRKHLLFIHKELPNLIILQSYLRMLKQRLGLMTCVRWCANNQEDALFVKMYVLTCVRRVAFLKKLEFYRSSLDDLVGIQALIRSYMARNDYNNLIHQTNPSLKHAYKYLNLLEFDSNDIMEENEIMRLKNLVYDKIREDNDLEDELKGMDVCIGLLVKNRINLQEVMSTSNKSKRKHNKPEAVTISKEKLELREKYGYVFYMLQCKSHYLARLLLQIAHSYSTKYVRDYIFSIFNLGTTLRDEYYLLKFFETALDMEITTKIDTIQAFSKDDPVMVKTAISFWRDHKAPTFLQPMLAEPINRIINFKESININSVDIYKQWVNKVESETGKSSGLPYDVEPDKAIEHEEVRNMLKINLDHAIFLTASLRDSILTHRDYIPYGIRYFAKSVHDYLNKKFETAPKEQLLKIVGNLLYYRFVNPAIVSPEGFNLLHGKSDITPEQRKNLATVSSILQNSAANRLFESSSTLMAPLDDFMKETASKFFTFFEECIDVESLEQHYNINEFTDQTLMQKPELKLHCSQILETHKMLLEYTDSIFPDEDDVLYVLLKDIGEVPKGTDLVDRQPPVQPSKADKKDKETQIVENEEEVIANTLIVLPLLPPRVLLETQENKNKEILNSTINMFVDILKFSQCETIPQVLESNFTPQQEQLYQNLQLKRAKLATDKQKSSTNEQPAYEEEPTIKLFTLEQLLTNVKENLKILEEAKLISSNDQYHDLLMAIIKKIVERTQYIKSRRMDMARYRTILDNLETNRLHYVTQMESYNLYIKGCIANMTQRKNKSSKKISIKKSAAKLHQSGIILDIDGLSPNKYKNVVFEFSSTDDPGTFIISGQLLGVTMNTYNLVFQNLLHLKFNNVNVIKILDVIKINVNLLIYFINQHFYLKK